MPISADQRSFLTHSLRVAIDKFYGERVPTLSDYTNQRRATYIEKLRELVGATELEAGIGVSSKRLGIQRAALTRLTNNKQAKREELNADMERRRAELEAWFKSEVAKLEAHYGQAINDAKVLVGDAEDARRDIVRAAYFTALGQEDDGRSLYRNADIADALKLRVDRYIEHNLDDEELGKQVAMRGEQEQLVGDIAYIAKNVEAMRVQLLHFINTNRLPPITMVAWQIEDGKDIA